MRNADWADTVQIDDCFILCDAGGGTADVVSYQVKKLKPHFELVKATDPDGRCLALIAYLC